MNRYFTQLFCFFSILFSGYSKISVANDYSVMVMQAKQPGEDFYTFFKKFNSERDFQLNNIQFPLKDVITDIDNHRKVKYLSKGKWTFTNLLKTKDVIIKYQKISSSSATVLQTMNETGMHVEYIFRRDNNVWKLVLINDNSD